MSHISFKDQYQHLMGHFFFFFKELIVDKLFLILTNQVPDISSDSDCLTAGAFNSARLLRCTIIDLVE